LAQGFFFGYINPVLDILLNNIMNTTPLDSEKTQHGGARAGAGRPRGTGNKITAKELLEHAEQIVGKPFAVSLLEGYRDSILNGDTKTRVTYEKIILDKTASTLFEGDIVDTTEHAEQRRTQFLAAMAAVSAVNTTKDEDSASN
jgi:hypothetical protein